MKKFYSKDCDEWRRNKSVNPITKKKISPKGKVSRVYEVMCDELKPKVKKDFQLITYFYDPVLILFLDDLEAMSLRESQLRKMVKHMRNVDEVNQFYDLVQDKKQELNQMEEIQKERVPYIRNVIQRMNVYNKKMLDKNLATVQEMLEEKLNPENYTGKAKRIIELINSF